jgi:hypothetical protein
VNKNVTNLMVKTVSEFGSRVKNYRMHACVRLEGDGGGHVAGWTRGWLGLPITFGSPRLPIYSLSLSLNIYIVFCYNVHGCIFV